jgi:hypothetical protein
MRTLALSGFAALAFSMMSPAAVWAWSSEPVAPKSAGGANFAESDDPLKALQEKVDAKSGYNSSQSGFYFSSGATRQPFSPYGFSSNKSDGQSEGVPFGYSPMPGFRGPAQ